MAKRVSGRAPLEKAELSLEEFTALPAEEGYRLELSRGRLVREPAPGPRHGQVAYALVDLLRRFGKEKGLGLLFFDVGFVLATDPPIVRVPDVAFVASDRVPEEGLTDRRWSGSWTPPNGPSRSIGLRGTSGSCGRATSWRAGRYFRTFGLRSGSCSSRTSRPTSSYPHTGEEGFHPPTLDTLTMHRGVHR